MFKSLRKIFPLLVVVIATINVLGNENELTLCWRKNPDKDILINLVNFLEILGPKLGLKMNNNILGFLCCQKNDIDKMKSFVEDIKLGESAYQNGFFVKNPNDKKIFGINIIMSLFEEKNIDENKKFSQKILKISAGLKLSDELRKWINSPEIEKVFVYKAFVS